VVAATPSSASALPSASGPTPARRRRRARSVVRSRARPEAPASRTRSACQRWRAYPRPVGPTRPAVRTRRAGRRNVLRGRVAPISRTPGSRAARPRLRRDPAERRRSDERAVRRPLGVSAPRVTGGSIPKGHGGTGQHLAGPALRSRVPPHWARAVVPVGSPEAEPRAEPAAAGQRRGRPEGPAESGRPTPVDAAVGDPTAGAYAGAPDGDGPGGPRRCRTRTAFRR